MKIILTTLCLVVMFTLANSKSASWGLGSSSDVLIHSENVWKNFLGSTEFIWSFPKSGQSNNKIITSVTVFDNMPKNGATTFLYSGGPGFGFVNLKFKPSIGYGVDSTVKIYAKK